MNGGSSKINRPTSYPSNPVSKTLTEVQVKTPPRLDETRSTSDSESNYDIIKVGLISAGLVSAFLIHRLFFLKRSTMNMTAPTIGSHAL